jgi:hypothetical protein
MTRIRCGFAQSVIPESSAGPVVPVDTVNSLQSGPFQSVVYGWDRLSMKTARKSEAREAAG